MAKDFAHKGNAGRQTASGPRMPGWVWLLVGIALGFAGAVGYYISRPTQVQAALEPLEKGKPARKKITIPPKEPSRFAFYELLPNYEVVIPKESLKPNAKPQTSQQEPTAPPGRYLIQVGSFRDRKEAEQQKANLALLGVESRVEKVTIDNEQTWYRVRIGPEKDQRRVESILARLEENEIKAMVMMVPD
ncbi:MAG TPA: SPOR domain-containing protein [Verrucomicrobiae bacterium]|nr:SPOR domain-containing protein [Verrucomicrobiae bacterium]